MSSKSFRFGIVLCILAALGVGLHLTRAEAAPPALDCSPAQAAISAPQSGATLNGVIQIEGNATLGSQFQYYKLEFAASGSNNFTVFSGLVRQPVTNGQLAVWDSASVPDGTYDIRLRVVDATGNYCEVAITGLKVQNSSPPTPTVADTPTPVETEVTPSFAVVPTAIPTIVIPGSTPRVISPQQTPSPPADTTQTPGSTSFLPGGLSTDSITGSLSNIFDSFVRAFLFGALAMAGIIVVVGAILFVRRML